MSHLFSSFLLILSSAAEEVFTNEYNLQRLNLPSSCSPCRRQRATRLQAVGSCYWKQNYRGKVIVETKPHTRTKTSFGLPSLQWLSKRYWRTSSSARSPACSHNKHIAITVFYNSCPSWFAVKTTFTYCTKSSIDPKTCCYTLPNPNTFFLAIFSS